MAFALFELKLKRGPDGYCRVFHPYALWHNQETGGVTVRTETGYYKFPADDIDSIVILQRSFAFSAEELDAYAKQREAQTDGREATPEDVAAVSGMMFGYHEKRD